jgi:hypothetical protein
MSEEHVKLNRLLLEPETMALELGRRLEGLTHAQRVVLALIVSAVEVYRAIRILVEHGLAEEARMLSRTLLDDATKLMWLSTDPDKLEERVLRYSWTSARYSRSLARAARENGWDWAEEMFSARAEEMESIRAEAKAASLDEADLSMPNTHELLSELGQERLSYWHFRASESIHSGAIGLSARFSEDPIEPETLRVRLQSPLDEAARVGIMSAELLISALVASCRLLPWKCEEDARRFGEDFSPRVESPFTELRGRTEDPSGVDSRQ